ncbi:MAG: RNA polymerase sigma factor region1.1 domain-containing protein, partial [Pirellulaceae bacterium]
METQPNDLNQLIGLARKQGFLTYDQVNHYLPDEANDADRLNDLVVTLER